MDLEKAVNEALHRSPEGLLYQRRLRQNVARQFKAKDENGGILFGRMRCFGDSPVFKIAALTSAAGGRVEKHDLTVDAKEVLEALRLASAHG